MSTTYKNSFIIQEYGAPNEVALIERWVVELERQKADVIVAYHFKAIIE